MFQRDNTDWCGTKLSKIPLELRCNSLLLQIPNKEIVDKEKHNSIIEISFDAIHLNFPAKLSFGSKNNKTIDK